VFIGRASVDRLKSVWHIVVVLIPRAADCPPADFQVSGSQRSRIVEGPNEEFSIASHGEINGREVDIKLQITPGG
jgi:hypothetical protein